MKILSASKADSSLSRFAKMKLEEICDTYIDWVIDGLDVSVPTDGDYDANDILNGLKGSFENTILSGGRSEFKDLFDHVSNGTAAYNNAIYDYVVDTIVSDYRGLGRLSK